MVTDAAALDPVEVTMKALTLGGVVAGAAGMTLRRLSPAARRRCFGVAAAGVALMFGNALIASSTLVVLVDVAYAALAAAALLDGLREARARERVAPAPRAVPTPRQALLVAARADSAGQDRPAEPRQQPVSQRPPGGRA